MSQREPVDFTELSWHDAFTLFCEALERTYVFARWKAIDWRAFRERFAAPIQDAQTRGDIQAYYRTLRAALFVIRDANVHLWGDDWDTRRALTQAGYGLMLVELDDGRVMVSHVAAGSAAQRAGIERGIQIVAWNDVPIETALRQTSIIWAEHPPATGASTRLQQCRFLPRTTEGAQAHIQFLKNKSTKTERVTLTARTGDARVDAFNGYTFPDNCVVEATRLDSGIAHVVVRGLPKEPLPGIDPETMYEQFREALLNLSRARAAGLVIDLRYGAGGNHELAARIAGFFHRQPIFYATAGYRNEADAAKLKADAHTLLQVSPQDLYWQAPLAVLINSETLGAGEGLARALQRAPHSIIVGATTSGGSFGHLTEYPMAEVWMPEGYVIAFPTEASLNQDGVIQIESNRFGEGGVRPTVRVPQTLRTFEQQYLEQQDVELAIAVQNLQGALRETRRQKVHSLA